jgi:AcrR family transcriptional regulator
MNQKTDNTDPEPKQRIFDAAVQLFARKGYGATGMREIAHQAEVNLAMINYFYGTKLNLLQAVLDDFFQGYLAIARRAAESDADPEAKLRGFIKEAAAYFSSKPDQVLIGVTQLPLDDPEVTTFKAERAKELIGVLYTGIMGPLYERKGIEVPLVMVGPALISLMFSHYLFQPVLKRIWPGGLNQDFYDKYPDVICRLFLDGFLGLAGVPGLGPVQPNETDSPPWAGASDNSNTDRSLE